MKSLGRSSLLLVTLVRKQEGGRDVDEFGAGGVLVEQMGNCFSSYQANLVIFSPLRAVMNMLTWRLSEQEAYLLQRVGGLRTL